MAKPDRRGSAMSLAFEWSCQERVGFIAPLLQEPVQDGK